MILNWQEQARTRIPHEKSSRHENRVPKIGFALTLKDGRKGKVVCGWYAKGKGGWRIMLELEDGKAIQIGLRDLRGVKERGH